MILPPLCRTAPDAARLAGIVHARQVDKAGRPYEEHLHRVAIRAHIFAESCPKLGGHEIDEVGQIAWLHDVIEDTPLSASDLLAEGFCDHVVQAVLDLTKPDNPVHYGAWIERLIDIADLPALLVKLADVEDNSCPDRLALLPAEDRERLRRKYEPARQALQTAARVKGWQG